MNYEQARNEIEAAYKEACEPNWLGGDEDAVTEKTKAEALAFAVMIPEQCEQPEICPEADGGIAFEWVAGKDHRLSVSIMEGRIVYAGILPHDPHKTFSGNTPLSGGIPTELKMTLIDYFSKKEPKS